MKYIINGGKYYEGPENKVVDFEYKSFRLLDDDGIIYFTGLAEVDLYDTEEGFEPLDEIGAEYGCIDIQYLEDGEYVSL